MTPATNELLRLIRSLDDLTSQILPQVENDPDALHILLARAATVVTRVCELAQEEELSEDAYVQERISIIRDRLGVAIEKTAYVRAEIIQATHQLAAARNVVHRLHAESHPPRLLGAA